MHHFIVERLTEFAEMTSAPVEFTGRLDRAGLQAELAGAAMLVMPSRYHEFAGYSALEAMAAGVPVIASDLGALPELVGEEHCVPANDPHALAARMRTLWRNPGRRRRQGNALITRARKAHSEERYVAGLEDVYARTSPA